MKNILYISLICLIAASCTSDKKSNLVELNLMNKGIPMTIMAPDSSKVKTGDFGLAKDVTIQKGDDYSVQVFAYDATTTDIAKAKAEQLAEVEAGSYFNKIISESPNGFIYETKFTSKAFVQTPKKVDSETAKTDENATINYGFRRIYIKGGKEYVFQTGLMGTFSLEDVQVMYDAVAEK